MDFKELERMKSEAVVIREAGKLTDSHLLFKKLIKDIEKKLSKDNSPELKKLYLNLLGEYVIQFRLEAKQTLDNALKLSKDMIAYENKNGLKSASSLRSIGHVLVDLGMFEEAEPYLKKLVNSYKGNIVKTADAKAHLARNLFRMGKSKDADKLIDEALSDFEKDSVGEEYKDVWQSRAYMFKSLVLNADRKRNEAIVYAKKALKLAKKENRVFRVKQAKELIKYLKN